MANGAPDMVSAQLQHEIEQFLYAEVTLLSEGRYREWLDLLTDDVRYWMPVRETRPTGEDGVAREHDLAIFDDDKAFLTARVNRFSSELAHAERPPSRVRYFVSNVTVAESARRDYDVRANLLVYQARLERTECFFVGRREDLLRHTESGFRIARRNIILDQVLLPRSISLFF